MTRERTVVLLCGPGYSSDVVRAALQTLHCELEVIQEPAPSRWQLVRGRIKRLGPATVIGQLAFQIAALPVLAKLAAARIAELTRHLPAVDAGAQHPIHTVASVNDRPTIALLRRLAPALVVVNGTRILSRELLASIDVPVVNMHMGITPAYRGVHGGYWALAEGRPELVGTTIHLVDPGIDTGAVLRRTLFAATAADNFATYPYLHLIAGLPLLMDVVQTHLAGELEPSKPPLNLPSEQRYHPTLVGYLRRRWTMGVK